MLHRIEEAVYSRISMVTGNQIGIGDGNGASVIGDAQVLGGKVWKGFDETFLIKKSLSFVRF